MTKDLVEYNGKKGVWRTIAGRKVFIAEGEDLRTAMKNSGKFKSDFARNRKYYTKDMVAKRKELSKEVTKTNRVIDAKMNQYGNAKDDLTRKMISKDDSMFRQKREALKKDIKDIDIKAIARKQRDKLNKLKYVQEINNEYALNFGDSSQNYEDTKAVPFKVKEKAVLDHRNWEDINHWYNDDPREEWDKMAKQISHDKVAAKVAADNAKKQYYSDVFTEKDYNKYLQQKEYDNVWKTEDATEVYGYLTKAEQNKLRQAHEDAYLGNKSAQKYINKMDNEAAKRFLDKTKGTNKEKEKYEYELYKRAKENPESIDPMTENSTDWEALEKKYGKKYENERMQYESRVYGANVKEADAELKRVFPGMKYSDEVENDAMKKANETDYASMNRQEIDDIAREAMSDSEYELYLKTNYPQEKPYYNEKTKRMLKKEIKPASQVVEEYNQKQARKAEEIKKILAKQSDAKILKQLETNNKATGYGDGYSSVDLQDGYKISKYKDGTIQISKPHPYDETEYSWARKTSNGYDIIESGKIIKRTKTIKETIDAIKERDKNKKRTGGIW